MKEREPKSSDAPGLSRRDFVSTVATAAAGLVIVPRHVLGRGLTAPSDLVNVAVVGINGQGATNTQAMWSQNIVAICDVDEALMEAKLQSWKNAVAAGASAGRQGGAAPAAAGRQGGAAPVSRWKEFGPSNGQKAADAKWTQDPVPVRRQRFVEQQLPKLKRYRDYREMLDKQKDIDGVVVATPDHMHAIIGSAAMDLGKHVYIQKPLCWSVQEARHLAKKAADTKVVTQMGNQGHSNDEARRGQEYLQAGVLGEIREVHVWTNRPLGYWPQGIPRPSAFTVDPATLKWNNEAMNAAPRREHVRQLPGAFDAIVGSVPWRRARRAVSPDLPSVQLARLGGLGPGRARRHGRASDRSSRLGSQAGPAHEHRDDLDALQQGHLSERDDDVLRVRRPGAACRR